MEMFGLSRESVIPGINLPDLVQTVFSALAAARLEPGRLELEITETALLLDNEVVLEKLHQLKSYGVQISVDDCGNGYSSLSYLRSFPFDKIKIDQSFVGHSGRVGLKRRMSEPGATRSAVAQRYFYGFKFSYMDNIKRR
jgi:EAL domain-containing protein (putative c-di-GMP-specific phosphodiesterase class I)